MNDTDCLIPLTQGKFAIVSQEDYEFLSQFKWHATKERTSYGYRWRAVRRMKNENGPRQSTIYMHREVAKRADLPESKQYDHEDRDGLNNSRRNLRPCTCSQNGANQTKQHGVSSTFKGVTWDKVNRKWKARIKVAGNLITLGSFDDEWSAHEAYAAAAVFYFGEFACP